jgi:hypothetical protein
LKNTLPLDKFRFAVMSMALAVAGCSSYHSAGTNAYSAAGLTEVGAAGGIPLQVDGQVGGIRGAPLTAVVAAAMPATVDGAKVHYAPCEDYSECAGDHVVWTFGPPPARSNWSYPPALSVNVNWIGNPYPSKDKIAAEATLFQNGEPVSTVSGQVTADGANDPAFQSMISEMSGRLLTGPGWFD